MGRQSEEAYSLISSIIVIFSFDLWRKRKKEWDEEETSDVIKSVGAINQSRAHGKLTMSTWDDPLHKLNPHEQRLNGTLFSPIMVNSKEKRGLKKIWVPT